MERRVLLAVALSIGLIFLVNVLFPPVRETVPLEFDSPSVADSPIAQRDEVSAFERETRDLTETDTAVGDVVARIDPGMDRAVQGDTIIVRSALYEYAFSTIGATLIGATLTNFETYAEDDPEGSAVQLVREGDHFLGYHIAVGGDTVRIDNREFSASRAGLDLTENTPQDSVVFVYDFPAAPPASS